MTDAERYPESESFPIREEDLNAWLHAYAPHLTCWRVGLYYGSTMYLYLGEPLEERSVRGHQMIYGSADVILCADDWVIFRDGREVCNSRIITREIAEGAMQELFVGTRPIGTRTSQRDLTHEIFFTENLCVRAWVGAEPSYRSGDDLISYGFPNGRLAACEIGLRPKPHLHFTWSPSHDRARAWRKKHLS